jgi:outer membrane protein assembly factor BamB
MLANGMVYIGSWDGSVYALDAATGKLIWNHHTEGVIDASPATRDDILFATSNDGSLYILNARTGQERLRFHTPGAVLSAPAVDNGLIYFTSGGLLYAVDAGANDIPGQYQLKKVWAQLWLWQVPGVPRPPVQQGGRWRLSTGRSSPGDIIAPLAVHEGAFYVGDTVGNFYARNAFHGEELWRFQVGSPIVAAAVIVGDRVYFGDRGGSLFALSRSNGELIWQSFLGAPIEVPPTFSQGRLYVRTSDGMMHALD